MGLMEDKDYEYARKILIGEKVENPRYAPIQCQEFSKFEEALDEEEVKGKRVLAKSGDYFFWALSHDPASIITFDDNRLAVKYLELKKAGYLALTKKEIYEFFCDNTTFFKKALFYKIIDALDEKTALFWKRLIYPLSQTEIVASNLFSKNGFRYNLELYQGLEDFEAIRAALTSLETHHYNVGLDRLKTRVGGEFDTIYLGNIDFKGNIGSLAEKVQARTFDILAINGVAIALVNKKHVIRFIKKQ